MAISSSRVSLKTRYRFKEQQRRLHSYFIAAHNATFEGGVLHCQDMSSQGLLPDGGVRLPSNISGPLPFDPKLKAIILYFMYFAGRAESETDSNSEIHALHDYAHIVASTLITRVYGVDVHPDSIKEYFWTAIANAEAVGKWDHYAVAEIISSQVQDEHTFDKVTSFVRTVNRVCSGCPIMVLHRFLQQLTGVPKLYWHSLTITDKIFVNMVLKATSVNRTASIMFESYWLGAARSKNRHTPLIRDPEMPSSRGDVDLRTASD